MSLKTGTEGIALIKQFEGCRLTAYKCPAGVWTIGYGHTKEVTQGQKITQTQAEELLVADLAKYEQKVNKYNDRYKWSQSEFDALVSFAYNVGSIDQLTAGGTRSRTVIADKMLEYVNKGSSFEAGLTRRRKAERALFLSEATKTATKETETAETKHAYTVGGVYTLQNNMYVRETAAGEKKPYMNLTANARKHAKRDKEGFGILNKGAKVTCKDIEHMNGAIWLKIPSGYVCAVSAYGKTYIK